MTEAQAAHLRLCSCLKKRTHEWTPPKAEAPATRVVKQPGVGRGGAQGKPVRISGHTFKSMKDACHWMRIGHKKFYEMLRTGDAKRVSPDDSKTR